MHVPPFGPRWRVRTPDMIQSVHSGGVVRWSAETPKPPSIFSFLPPPSLRAAPAWGWAPCQGWAVQLRMHVQLWAKLTVVAGRDIRCDSQHNLTSVNSWWWVKEIPLLISLLSSPRFWLISSFIG